MLSTTSDADVPFDEEFYNHMCATHGAALRDKIFFFVDNRNVIGKDVPFQRVHHKRFGQPLFRRSVRPPERLYIHMVPRLRNGRQCLTPRQ